MKLTNIQLTILAATFVVLAGLLVVILVAGLSLATFLSALTTVTTTLVLLFGLQKIDKQTNGTLSKLTAENARKEAVITALAAAATPKQVADAHQVAEDTITHQALNDIKESKS